MSKVKFLIIIGIFVIPYIVGAIVKTNPVYKNHRRIGLNFEGSKFYDQILDTFNNSNDFFDNFFNVNGKPHDRGADYMLTDDIYQKPNPFYTKKANKDNNKTGLRDHLFPVYIPKHNETNDNSVQESAQTQSVDTYQPPPATTYDEKTHTYNAYLPPSSYGPYPPPTSPSSSYGSASSFEQPSSSYGPSIHPTYGPPTYAPTASYYPHYPSYIPPTSSSHSSYYPTAPHHEADQKAHEGFFLKLIKKFDLVLMSKILLKLIIFKKIIKFIAVMCLLLFLPTLKKKFESLSGNYNEDEDRKYKLLDAYSNVDFRVKEIASFALTAIEGFETHQIPWCVGESELYCRVQYMLDQVDFRYPGQKILSLWFPKLATTVAPTTESSKINEKYDNNIEVQFNDYIADSAEKVSSSIENTNSERKTAN